MTGLESSATVSLYYSQGLHTIVTLVFCRKWSMLKESIPWSVQLWHSWMPLLSLGVMSQSFLLRSTAPLSSPNEHQQHTPFPDEWAESTAQVSVSQCQCTVSHQLACVNEAWGRWGAGGAGRPRHHRLVWLWRWSPAPPVWPWSHRGTRMLRKAHLRLVIVGGRWQTDADSVSAQWSLLKPFRVSLGFCTSWLSLVWLYSPSMANSEGPYELNWCQFSWLRSDQASVHSGCAGGISISVHHVWVAVCSS